MEVRTKPSLEQELSAVKQELADIKSRLDALEELKNLPTEIMNSIKHGSLRKAVQDAAKPRI